MTSRDSGSLIFMNGVANRIGPADKLQYADHEALIRADYERHHPDDTFEDLKKRARFSKEDKGLLRAWMAVAAQRTIQQHGETGPPPTPAPCDPKSIHAGSWLSPEAGSSGGDQATEAMTLKG